jgi:exoribonuclease R
VPTPRQHLTASTVDGELAASLTALRTELEIPVRFPDEVEEEAAKARAVVPDLDLRDIPFATLDPAGSLDLDQAFHLERRGSGWRVRYAIADVPGFVSPGSGLDEEARRRGQTLYGVDGTVPLHPTVLSEGSASLLPGVDRPAYVWTFELDDRGAETSHRVERALIHSVARLDYVGTQSALDHGAETPAALLPEIGRARQEQEVARGGASLNVADEDVERDAAGAYHLLRRRPLPVEDWNAQLSLLTGMAGAAMMLDARIGILRTMPAPDAASTQAFRLRCQALGLPWPEAQPYGEYLRGLERDDPQTLAVLHAAASLFRGATYVAFDGTSPSGTVPSDTIQAALAAPYTHTTAPLRRLVDRWALVICEAVSNGRAVPGWARDSLEQVPQAMHDSTQLASRLYTGSVARVEAALVQGRIGDRVDAVVLGVHGGKAQLQLTDPAVTASCAVPDTVQAGHVVPVTITCADIAKGTISLAVAGPER